MNISLLINPEISYDTSNRIILIFSNFSLLFKVNKMFNKLYLVMHPFKNNCFEYIPECELINLNHENYDNHIKSNINYCVHCKQLNNKKLLTVTTSLLITNEEPLIEKYEYGICFKPNIKSPFNFLPEVLQDLDHIDNDLSINLKYELINTKQEKTITNLTYKIIYKNQEITLNKKLIENIKSKNK